MKNVTWSLALLAALASSCGGDGKQGAAEEAVPVKVMAVGASGATAGNNYTGTVAEDSATPLSFLTGGTITSLRVKVGQRVQKGQLIATVDDASLRQGYDMAHATRQQAEDAHARMKQLHDKGSLPDIKWVEAESQLAQAVAAEKIAKKALDDARLYAPYGGVISEKNAEVGQTAAPGVPVAKLAATQTLNVEVSVPEGDVAALALGQRATMDVAALGRQYTGRIVEKGIVADALARTYKIKIRVENADGDLLPGMVARVELTQGKDHSSLPTPHSSIVIPSRLLQLADDNTYFVWVDDHGKAARRTVAVGGFTAGGVAISGGLAQGDRVIAEGQQKVCDGTPIKTKQ